MENLQKKLVKDIIHDINEIVIPQILDLVNSGAKRIELAYHYKPVDESLDSDLAIVYDVYADRS